MQLTAEQLAYIELAISTTNLIKADNLVIEPGIVRSIDENKNAFILHTDNVIDLDFNAIAFGRCNTFLTRLNLVRFLPNFNIEVTADELFAKSLKMKGKGLSIDFKCSSPNMIKSPKKFNNFAKYQVELTTETITTLNNAMGAMQVDIVNIKSDNSGVSYIVTDMNNDKLIHNSDIIADNVHNDEPPYFSFNYPIKIILPLFKQNPPKFKIYDGGFLGLQINGFDIFVLPHVENMINT